MLEWKLLQPTWEYQMMPPMAMAMPAAFLGGMVSPKNMQPPIRMITVLMCPTWRSIQHRGLQHSPIPCMSSHSFLHPVVSHVVLKTMPVGKKNTVKKLGCCQLTTLYVRLLVAPMTRKVLRLTSSPSAAEMAMAMTAAALYWYPSRVSGVGSVSPIGSKIGTSTARRPAAIGEYSLSNCAARARQPEIPG